MIPGGTANLILVIVAIACGLVPQCHAIWCNSSATLRLPTVEPRGIYRYDGLIIDESPFQWPMTSPWSTTIHGVHTLSPRSTGIHGVHDDTLLDAVDDGFVNLETFTQLFTTELLILDLCQSHLNLSYVYDGIAIPSCGLGPLSSDALERLVDEVETLEQAEEMFSQLKIWESMGILKMLNDLDVDDQIKIYSHLERWESMGILKMLKGLDVHDQIEIYSHLERWESMGILKMLNDLDVHDQKIVYSHLERWESMGILKMLKGLDVHDQIEIYSHLERWESMGILKMLNDLDVHDQIEIYSHLEIWESMGILKMLNDLDVHDQIEIYSHLERWESMGILKMLKGLDVHDQKKVYSHLERWESMGILKMLNGLVVHDQIEIYSHLERWESMGILKMLNGLDIHDQIKMHSQLERWESMGILKMLKGLDVHDQIEIYSHLERWESMGILKMLKGLDVHDQLKMYSQLKVIESLEMLRVLEGLEVEEQRELLTQLYVMSQLGQLKQLRELEIPGQLKLMRLMKPFKQEQGMFKTTKVHEKMAILGSGILKTELARLGKPGQESEREERLRLFLEHYKNLQQQLVAWFVIYLSEGGGRGSFRNLLLDGWWFEFWELILLMAGDVERNPGPRQMTDEQLASVDSRALGKGDLFEVFDAVYDCRSTWYNLCLALRVSDDDLAAIEKEQASDIGARLRKGLSLWLHRVYDTKKHGPPTWRMLVDAVANSSGGNNHALALEIADKYSSDMANPTAPLQISTLNCVGLEYNEKSEEMSSDFSRMYRSVIQHLRVDVCQVRDSLRFLTDPRHPDQLCVPTSVYKDVTTTKELLDCLCPRYVNPKKTIVLKVIMEECEKVLQECEKLLQECEKLLQDYTEKSKKVT